MRRTVTFVIVGALAAACGKGGSGDPHSATITEAELRLNELGTKAKKAFYRADNAFPTGTVGPTPATPCCQNADHWCQPNPADWGDPVWQQLDFRLDDRYLGQYSYQSDGKTFTATAVVDPGCAGEPKTWQLRGEIKNGEPALTLIKP